MFKNWFCLVGFAYLASGKIDGLWGGTLKKWDGSGYHYFTESGGKLHNHEQEILLVKLLLLQINLHITNY